MLEMVLFQLPPKGMGMEKGDVGDDRIEVEVEVELLELKLALVVPVDVDTPPIGKVIVILTGGKVIVMVSVTTVIAEQAFVVVGLGAGRDGEEEGEKTVFTDVLLGSGWVTVIPGGFGACVVVDVEAEDDDDDDIIIPL